VARAVSHSWFHAGDVNAVRQLLGHAEIRFVGDPGATPRRRASSPRHRLEVVEGHRVITRLTPKQMPGLTPEEPLLPVRLGLTSWQWIA
jgi:hypothetical protein